MDLKNERKVVGVCCTLLICVQKSACNGYYVLTNVILICSVHLKCSKRAIEDDEGGLADFDIILFICDVELFGEALSRGTGDHKSLRHASIVQSVCEVVHHIRNVVSNRLLVVKNFTDA